MKRSYINTHGRKRYFVAMLAAPGVGLIHSTECPTRVDAQVLLYDRQESGESFPHEFVVRVPEFAYQLYRDRLFRRPTK